ncbi:MAG TPA: hypothetical protein VK483_01925 [Chitinophagaceae bacterium]|nr:hypothetical protein [Chitinophagaceae bacterium]
MKRYWILFVVLTAAIYVKSRSLDFRPGTTREETIRQLIKEINELKKNQENRSVVLENNRH